ncbi:MAG: GNAT family N-acetyltransferase [Candidatus Melainabacteria bacterium HGW-Melainabacteria-1]|nr:MAG: GNAT family N-acetyltransferase [Candidatus Melainabacteria bacterium HGW-Melainabacteria-1]
MRICLHDRQQISAYLKLNPGLNLYLTGDLDDFFWPHTSWYGWWAEDQLQAVALLYSGDDLPVLLALGGEAMPQLLAALRPLLPKRFYAHLGPAYEQVLAPDWRLSGGEPHLRMLLTHPEQLTSSCPEAEVAGPDDLAGLQALYAEAYPHNWFNSRMLKTGHYLGVRRDGQWLAVAGVHVFAPQQGVAALGNITVHPQWRNQGWGSRLTAALCRRLLQHVELIGLNVHAANQPAIRCYQKLGFEVVAEYWEWTAEST